MTGSHALAEIVPIATQPFVAPSSYATPSRIRKLSPQIHAHGAVVIRDVAGLTQDDLVALGTVLGQLHLHPFEEALGQEQPQPVMVLRRKAGSSGVRAGWHSDVSFGAQPPVYGLLWACEVPVQIARDAQIATELVDARLLWEALPRALQSKLSTCTAWHDFAVEEAIKRKQQGDAWFEWLRARLQPVPHPAIWRHPPTGRPVLAVDEAHTRCLTSADGREQAEWLRQTQAHLLPLADERSYQHLWRQNDLLIWDQRCMFHRGDDSSHEGTRLLWRVLAGQHTPVGYGA